MTYTSDATEREQGEDTQGENEEYVKSKGRESLVTWDDEGGEWMVGTIISNFRSIKTKFGQRYVVNIQLTEERKDAIWLGDKVRGGSKEGNFLEALGHFYRDKAGFNPLEFEIGGREILCLWGIIKSKGKLREGITRFKGMD